MPTPFELASPAGHPPHRSDANVVIKPSGLVGVKSPAGARIDLRHRRKPVPAGCSQELRKSGGPEKGDTRVFEPPGCPAHRRGVAVG